MWRLCVVVGPEGGQRQGQESSPQAMRVWARYEASYDPVPLMALPPPPPPPATHAQSKIRRFGAKL